jgi:mannose-6-phosphate isomerase-like protein (cupin superfamily)
MLTTATRGYVVRHVDVAPSILCPCGTSTRPLTSEDTPACSLHVTFIKDSVRHYHRETTEVYYILEGRGRMELDDDLVDIEPGLTILIEPNTRHRLISREGVRTIVFSVPAFKADDEHFDEAS